MFRWAVQWQKYFQARIVRLFSLSFSARCIYLHALLCTQARRAALQLQGALQCIFQCRNGCKSNWEKEREINKWTFRNCLQLFVTKNVHWRGGRPGKSACRCRWMFNLRTVRRTVRWTVHAECAAQRVYDTRAQNAFSAFLCSSLAIPHRCKFRRTERHFVLQHFSN